ncbi:hypothetical protein [Streptomyces sp. NPDC055749]
MSQARTDAAGPRRAVLELLTHGTPGEERGESGRAAASLRAALSEGSAPVPARLVAAARTVGELGDGLATELVRRARPARTLAGHLLGALRPGSAADALLCELTEQHLAGDPERWRGLHDALATSRHTLPELLAARPAPADGPTVLPPKSVCDTLGLLLERTVPRHAAAALTALPDRTVEGLLAGGSLPGPVLSAAVTRHGDSRARTVLARHPRIDARVLKELVAADDPAVNAAVYRNARCTPSLRRAIVHAMHRVPLDEALRAELLSATSNESRSRAAPLLGSGDLLLASKALAWGVRKVAQRYALLRVWECQGPDAVRTALADPVVVQYVHESIRTEVAAALAAPDGPAVPRAAAIAYEDPAALPQLLSVCRGTSTLRDLLNEPYAHDFRALAAANRQTPFMPKAAEELIRHEDATDAERAEFRLTLLNAPWRAGGRIAGNLTPPSRRLAEESLDAQAAEWAVGVVRAGLLDPAELVTTARPAALAAQALFALAEHGLWGGQVHDELAARPDAWAVLLESLPEHPGTLAEAIEEAIDEAARLLGNGGVTPTGPRSAAPYEPPAEPVGHAGCSALGAVDLLLSLVPAGTAPLPQDPAVLRYLAAHRVADAPGWRHPDWLWKACTDRGLEDVAHRCEAPEREEVLASFEGATPTDSVARAAERAYLHGIVQADDLLCHLPAAWLLHLPHGWEDFAFTAAWRRALAAFLDRELGTDADAWLRLAATARGAAATDGDPHGPERAATWPRLLERSRREGPYGTGRLRELCAGVDTVSTFAPTLAPTTPKAAGDLLARGNHLWAWPLGTLLCAAGPGILAEVLPRYGPDGPWMLAAFLLRCRPTPHVPFEYLLRSRDRAALRVLSEHAGRLGADQVSRLVDLADPETDLAVLRNTSDPRVLRRIAARPGSLAPRLVEELRSDPLAHAPGGTVWLESAEPDLVELVLTRSGKRLNLAQQLVGCLNLLRSGGPERLAALAGSGVLGTTATRLCQKALAADDPAAPLNARTERELSAERLAKRLRRAQGHWVTREILDSTPALPDWDGLQAEHSREPIPGWDQVVRHPDAPHAFVVRNAAHLWELSLRSAPPGRELTVARARHGLGGHRREPVDVVLDHLLRTGRLTARDLIHEAAPAAVVLGYLNRARRRSDAPEEVRTALGEVAELVRERLGDDTGAWYRVFARLTEREQPDRVPAAVSSLLAAP